jgi:hypothetical protein
MISVSGPPLVYVRLCLGHLVAALDVNASLIHNLARGLSAASMASTALFAISYDDE